MAFAVVVFTGRCEVAVIPINWISKRLDQSKALCHWPPYKSSSKVTKAAMKAELPDRESWTEYHISILKECDTYEKARKKLAKAERESDLTSADDGIRKRKAPQRYESDSDEDPAPPSQRRKKHSKKMPALPSAPVFPGKTLSGTSSGGKDVAYSPSSSVSVSISRSLSGTASGGKDVAYSPSSSASVSISRSLSGTANGGKDVAYSPSSSPSVSVSNPYVSVSSSSVSVAVEKTPSTTTSRSASPVQSVPQMDVDDLYPGIILAAEDSVSINARKDNTTIIRLLNDIKGQTKQNAILLKALLEQKSISSTALDSSEIGESFHLPLRSKKDVLGLEKILQDKEKKKVLLTYLRTFGGRTHKQIVDTLMAEVISTRLAESYNWLGRGTKSAFSQLKLANCVKEAARTAGVPISFYEDRAKAWLRVARDREGGRKKRAELKRIGELADAMCSSGEESDETICDERIGDETIRDETIRD